MMQCLYNNFEFPNLTLTEPEPNCVNLYNAYYIPDNIEFVHGAMCSKCYCLCTCPNLLPYLVFPKKTCNGRKDSNKILDLCP